MPFVKLSTDGKREVQVRALLATVFAAAIIAGFFTKLISEESFMPLATMAVSWYFARRSESES